MERVNILQASLPTNESTPPAIPVKSQFPVMAPREQIHSRTHVRIRVRSGLTPCHIYENMCSYTEMQSPRRHHLRYQQEGSIRSFLPIRTDRNLCLLRYEHNKSVSYLVTRLRGTGGRTPGKDVEHDYDFDPGPRRLDASLLCRHGAPSTFRFRAHPVPNDDQHRRRPCDPYFARTDDRAHSTCRREPAFPLWRQGPGGVLPWTRRSVREHRAHSP